MPLLHQEAEQNGNGPATQHCSWHWDKLKDVFGKVVKITLSFQSFGRGTREERGVTGGWHSGRSGEWLQHGGLRIVQFLKGATSENHLLFVRHVDSTYRHVPPPLTWGAQHCSLLAQTQTSDAILYIWKNVLIYIVCTVNLKSNFR